MSKALKALEILKARKVVLELNLKNRIDNSYNIQYEDDNQITSAILEELKFVDEAIKELKEYEQNFKQKEFEYRTDCQNLVSAGRVEADNMPDRLAELEKVILDYYLAQGYVVGVDGLAFNVVIRAWHKNKRLLVYFRKASWDFGSICFSSNKQETTKEMFDKAIEYFSTRQNEVIECNQTKS